MRASLRTTFIPLILLMGVLVQGCGEKIPVSSIPPPSDSTLSIVSHESSGKSWPNSPVTADVSWRFISYVAKSSGVDVTGAWSVSWTNPSTSRYEASIGRLVFEDKEGFQLGEFNPILDVDKTTIEPSETRQRKGNFTVSLSSLSVANSVTRMGVWASFTEK
jgi:hypothetical protein